MLSAHRNCTPNRREKYSRRLAAKAVAAMIETSNEIRDLGRNSLWVWW